MLITEGALTWPTDPASAPQGYDATMWARAVQSSISHLWAATARTYGLRDAVYRPQGLSLTAGYRDAALALYAAYGWVVPDFRGGTDVANAVLELPGPAVQGGVTEVRTVDSRGAVTVMQLGVNYRQDGNYVVRTDGGTWPTSQNLLANDGQANTWHVAYSRGSLPQQGKIAAYELAVQFYKRLAGDKTCVIPWNATQVSRGGVTIVRDVGQMGKATGVEFADRWVAQINPQGLQQQPTIWSPDLPRGGRPYVGSREPYLPVVGGADSGVIDGGGA